VILPSASMKSMFAPLSVVTTWNGPHLLGAGKPKISARNVADALLSPAYTMVWLKLIDMPTSLAFAPLSDMRNADTRSLVQSTDLIGFGRKAVLKSKMAAGRREA
jgi:hypothetical protein